MFYCYDYQNKIYIRQRVQLIILQKKSSSINDNVVAIRMNLLPNSFREWNGTMYDCELMTNQMLLIDSA